MNLKIIILIFLSIFATNSYAQFYNYPTNFKSADPSNKINPNISLKRSNYGSDYESKFTYGTNISLWLMSIDGSVALPMIIQGVQSKTPTAKVKLKFSDVIKYMKYGVMFAGNFKYKNYRFLYEIDYVKLKYNASVPFNSGYKSAAFSSTIFTSDLSIGYGTRVRRTKIQNVVYVGARIWSLDNALDLISNNDLLVNAAASRTWIDPIAGVVTSIKLSQNWDFHFKAEAGGLNINSKLSYLLSGIAMYKISSNWNTSVGFKFLDVNYNKDNFIWNVAQSGLLLSVGYQMQ